ncbi:ABC transporter ATP-binding protein [Ruania zhangjianzhongii]|uniref:ABC transporter ATP-binding protein n=1 Tax=Ruania zhangjianzhongii TaxID=2603206 RepID=UPI0016527219|nr:ABC transporter ATP-binding protein [Ruania zhangjianzhongii]
MADLVRTEQLTVTYPGARAPHLRQVSIAVGQDERVLLLGPSGAGKSTLLRTLAGVVPQTVDAEVTGQVSVCASDPRSTPVPQLAGQVATLMQDPADQLCLPTVAEEVAFALENRAVPAEQMPPRVTAALQAVGAGHLGGRRTSELSGGEGQRVALAAALVAGPRLLLLDEPTALLDPAGARSIGALLAGLDGASLLIEHRLDELGPLPTRCVVFDRCGSVVADGPSAAVLTSGEVAATGSWLPATAELTRVLRRPVSPAQLGGALTELAGRAPRPAPRPAGPVLLAARDAEVRRGESVAVAGVDLELRAGQITAVLGVNGSGKSSLLLGLAGLLPAAGVRGLARVGMVFQNPEHQFLTRTVADEIGYGLPAGAGAPAGAGPGAAVGSVLERYQLTGLAAADPFRLSGGQQRRLSLAAMTVMADDVLLADEPTFGQDRRTAAGIGAELARLAGEGRAVVLASHDLRLVAALADQVLLLAGGRPVAVGTVDEVLTPAVLARAGLHLPPLLAAWPGPLGAARDALALLEREAAPVGVAA